MCKQTMYVVTTGECLLERQTVCACVQKYEGCLRRAKLTDNTIMLWNDGCAISLCHGCTIECSVTRAASFPLLEECALSNWRIGMAHLRFIRRHGTQWLAQ